MVDILYLDELSAQSFYEEEGVYDGIPTARVGAPASVRGLYTEGRMLARAFTSVPTTVLAYTYDSKPSATNTEDEATIARMAAMLERNHSLDSEAIAAELGLDINRASQLFSRALDRTAERIAQEPQAAERTIDDRGNADTPAYFVNRLRIAHDRRLAHLALMRHGGFESETTGKLEQARSIEFPPFVLLDRSVPHFVRLEESDIRDWRSFCATLVKEKDEPDESFKPGKLIWKHLSDEAREAVQMLAEANESNVAARATVIASLSAMLQEPDFYEDKYFEEVFGADEATQAHAEIVLGKLKLFREQVAGLNRQLFEAAFSDQVVRRPAPESALGFVNATKEEGVLRRLTLVAKSGDRCIVHLGLATLCQQLGLPVEKLQLGKSRLRFTPQRSAPLDRRGQLVINWPFDERTWATALPSVSVESLLTLAQYDHDVCMTKHYRRELIAKLDSQTTKGGWDSHFRTIQQAYEKGDFLGAAKLERTFDENAVEQVLGNSQVRAIMAGETQPPESGNAPGGEPGQNSTIPVLAREVAKFQQELPRIERARQQLFEKLSSLLQGKVCLIGDTSTASTDIKQTPVGSIPGTVAIAAAMNTVLTERYLTDHGYPVSALAMVILAGGLSVPVMRLKPIPAGICGLAGLFAAFTASWVLLAAADRLVSPITPMVGMTGVFLALTTYHWLVEYRQKTLVRTIFAAQTNPTIVDRLIEAGQAGVEEVLAPKNRQVTVFFAEIANFEELTGQVAAEKVPEILGRTFGTMAKVILAKEGTLDRYQGHAMVAFFGAPVYQPDHALRACQAALECRDAIRRLADSWRSQQLPAPRIQIGLHTGELLVGNITLTTRVDYTVAGDNLNIAYRIGELNETYGTEIMISEATLIRCEKQIEARELDMVRIKGRREPVRAFELMSAKGQLAADQLQLCGTFTTGLMAFRNRDYANAVAMFRACKATAPADRPSTLYIERCERELAHTKVAAEPPAES